MQRDIEELVGKTLPESGCWLWTEGADSYGYGTIRVNGKNTKAHRLSWMLHRGEIPEGKHVKWKEGV